MEGPFKSEFYITRRMIHKTKNLPYLMQSRAIPQGIPHPLSTIYTFI